VQTNTSVRNIVINSLQNYNGNDLPVLGRLFMSSAYVMVNHDAGKFSVWQANTGSKTSDIVAIDKKHNMVTEFCANSTGAASGATSLPTSPATPPPQDERPQMPGGVIGGIIVGALAGIAILGAIGFFLYRRRGSGGAAIPVAEESDSQMVDAKPPATYSAVPAEPQELSVERYNVMELDGKAVDGRRC
jgi:hypothetical protein